MRIGITCYPGVGGSGILATRLGVEFAKRDHEVHFITYERPFAVQGIDQENVHIHLVNVLEYPLFKYPPYTVALGSEMARVSQQEKLDVLNVHYSIPHATAAFLAREITGVPYVVTLHGSDVTILGSDPSYHIVNNHSVEKADAVTAVSEFMQREAYERLGIEREVKVIPNFVDTQVFAPAQCEAVEADCNECGGIIHVSNFRPVKRVADLVYAMAIVTKEEPKAKLTLVGDGPDRHGVEKLIDRLDLHRNVTLTGFRSDIPNLMRCADIGVLCSETESAPLTLLEGMSTGLPMVSTKVGGVLEIIDDGKNGLLVPPKNPEELAQAILRLYKDQRLRGRLGERARKTVLKRYTAEKVVNQYLKIFEAVKPRG
ncbi:MAG: N-acetyl-alpha-D-glucosaminyl L-malate synthase BshA [Candidatus Bathyarchaeota archaeon]|nr:N-acetyl-alpha-D-glucosaminyl L-malate synthase BshA [Candidatus Bathyarchaeota archaeon]